MLNDRSRITLLAVVASAVVAGCSTANPESGSEDAVKTPYRAEFRSMPDDVYDQVLPYILAREISSTCEGIYVSRGALDDANLKLWQGLERRGYWAGDVRIMMRNLDEKRVEEDLISYLRDNDIVSREGLCDAGRKEIADQSAIGSFLKG